jgi:VHL beta domain
LSRARPQLAQAVRQSLPAVQKELASLGEVESVVFNGVGPRGEDVYAVHFANGDAEWRIVLAPGGTIDFLQHGSFKEATRLPLANIGALRSGTASEATAIEFLNKSDDSFKVYWIDPDGQLRSYGILAPHHIRTIQTYVSHLWLIGRDEQHPVAIFNSSPGLTVGTVD